MTVLHLLGADEDTGGILSVLRNLQSATETRNCHHVVLVNRAFRESRKPSLSYRYSTFLLAESPKHFSLLFRAVASVPEVLRLLRGESFDVVHAHSRGAFPLACLLAVMGRNVVFTNHAYARRTRMYRAAMRLKRFHMVCLTPNMARHYGIPLEAPRLRIISACCADRFFNVPLAERTRSQGAHQVLRIVGVGNIIRWKNWHLMLDALNLLPPNERMKVQFEHWGPTMADADSQNYRAELEEKCRRLELNHQCKFHGHLDTVEAVLRSADWFVIPSTNEPCSVALIEALALGVPAIASASGGNVDIVKPERTGLLFKPEDVSSLAQCLTRVVRGDVGIAGPAEVRDSVRHRSASAVAADYLELYNTVRQGGTLWPGRDKLA